MKRILTESERKRLDELIIEAEKLTRIEIVLSAVKRSDSYAEIPWKAFAFGASLAALFMFLFDLLVLTWVYESLVLATIALMLAVGILLAGLTLLFPVVARLFLSRHRKEMETIQYAESMFLNRELFTTKGRKGVLLLVSIFERQVVIIPDKGLRDILEKSTLLGIIDEMTQILKRGHVAQALELGINRIIEKTGSTTGGDPKDELSNEIIEEEGL